MRYACFLAVILSFLLFSGGVYSQSQDSGIKVKSYSNWFAENLEITSSGVSNKDLLESPRNGDWLLYHGGYGADRFSTLKEINSNNVSRLVLKWIYQVGRGGFNLRSSPVVYKGMMYVTGSDEVHALDAATGTWLWVWRAHDDDSSGYNRGVAIYGDKLFFATEDCHMVALDRKSGNVVWSKQFADPADNYFSSAAPLVVGSKVIIGISGRNSGARGFIAAFSAEDGGELWRFWTTSADRRFRGAPTWMTGSYDPVLGVIYWPVGVLENKSAKSLNGDGVYDNSIVALNPHDGRLYWETVLAEEMPFYWDANEPLVLADVVFRGSARKVIMLAHRNGMFYLIDRTDGKIIFSKPFVSKLDWYGKDACPSVEGATNWMSPSFNPTVNLFYVMTLEGCRSGPNALHIKAVDSLYGATVWDYAVRGSNMASPGILSTEGNIVFSGEGSGHIVVLDAKYGKRLWDFSTGKPIFASPVTYVSNGRQMISIVAGSDVLTFGLY